MTKEPAAGGSQQPPTPDQIDAVRRVQEAQGKGCGELTQPRWSDVQTILNMLPDAVKHPQPVLPTEPGIYADRDGSPWHLKDGCWWFGNKDRYPESNGEDERHIQAYAPFTRLVPEKMLADAWDEGAEYAVGYSTAPLYDNPYRTEATA
jgi:hypothetical protein